MAATAVEEIIKPCILHELNPKLNITLINDARQLAKLDEYLQSVPVFGLDTETNMVTDFTERRIRTIQIGDKQQQFVIDLLPFAAAAGTDLVASQGPYRPTHETLGSPHACFQSLVDVLKPVLESKQWTKVGHNLQFDYETLKWCLGICPWNLYDTFLAEHLRWAGIHHPFESNYWGLEDLVTRYCHMKISKDFQTGFDLTSPLSDDHINYAALDTRLSIAVRTAQLNRLTEKDLLLAAQIEFDAIPAFGDMHLNGMQIDTESWEKLAAVQDAICKRAIIVMDRYTVPIFGRKDSDTLAVELALIEGTWRDKRASKELTKQEEKKYARDIKTISSKIKKLDDKIAKCEGLALINYGSPIQILKVINQLGFKLKSTDDSLLKQHKSHPFIEALLEYRKADKGRSTYGLDFLVFINSLTNRVHGRVNQLGTSTGRTSSSNPNLQNIKRESDYRSCFIARPGYKIITLDYNGAELRIATEYSKEPVWVDAFNKGYDLHSIGAEIVFGDVWKQAAEENCAYYKSFAKCSCKKHENLRKQVKAVKFGILYGIGPGKLASELEISEKDALNLLTTYKAKFPILINFLRQAGKQASVVLEARSLSKRGRFFIQPTRRLALLRVVEDYGEHGVTQGRVSSALRGMFASIQREGANMAIQGSNADMIKLAMGCGESFMWQKLESYFGAKLIMMVHDELVVECPEEHVYECRDFVLDCMVRGGEYFVKSVPTVVEAKIDTKWAKG